MVCPSALDAEDSISKKTRGRKYVSLTRPQLQATTIPTPLQIVSGFNKYRHLRKETEYML